MKKYITIKMALIVVALYPLIANADQVCKVDSIKADTPTSRFEILSNSSEIKDTQTGLIWQRCSLGQAWDGKNCIGKAKAYTWEQALKQTKVLGKGYRLPNIRELSSIVERQCYNPAITGGIFPNTQSSDYWSSSPSMNSDSVWSMNFNYGYTLSFSKNDVHYVRAVRSK
ncbi:Lcl C-terminal domain-containing protein [Psychrobacter sp. I-STPA10]|uniref:Lcl C-terminal domain-containing protein n=1 Tax=Psychrobacter sp. I-STPA10 TaxID=2585769 RepID=UPI001E2E67D7|nr:DUF1566 domain-containing protein [Psychrobacter sp. I-STPA10]